MKAEVFDVKQVPLSGTNLIEASAGTGKTYSVSVMVVRLILEQDIAINEILLVTFTNAAVDELKGRVRDFVKSAFNYVKRGKELQGDLKNVVDSSLKALGEEVVEKRLESSLLLMDEAMICTIHSFCQSVITEFSFETGQTSGKELIQDHNDIVEKLVNEYWRSIVPKIPKPIFWELMFLNLERKQIMQAVLTLTKGVKLEGRIFKNLEEGQCEIDNVSENLAEQKQSLIEQFDHEFDEIKKASRFPKKITNGTEFFELALDQIKRKKIAKYLSEHLVSYLEQMQEYYIAQCNLELAYIQYFATLVNEANARVSSFLNDIKSKREVLTFDDLISILHQVIQSDKEGKLKQKIKWKYKAAFIDEFQDTDKLQFDIFHGVFHHQRPLFYIGDPKQAIYAFRQADLEVYKTARRGVDKLYSMNTNYRSTPKLISAFNDFFSPDESFDTFLDDDIKYVPVKSGLDDIEVLIDNKIPLELSYSISKNAEEKFAKIALDILELLNQGSVKGERINPNQIGVLVSKKAHGQKIKEELSKFHIPAVLESKQHVLNTHAARLMIVLLEAVISPSIQTINKVLVTDLTSLKLEQIVKLKLDDWFSIFYKVQENLELKGLFAAVKFLFTELNLEYHFSSGAVLNGVRTYSNLNQVLELIHNHQLETDKSVKELCSWLKSFSVIEDSDQKVYEQYIDSDFEAVQIVTIHKSKGLAYDFVFTPDLDLTNKPSSRHKSLIYRDDNLGGYVLTFEKTEEHIEKYQKQQSEENRRLIYVALTRAKYGVNIYTTNSDDFAITPFLESEKVLEHSTEASSTTTLYDRGIKPRELKPFDLVQASVSWQMQSYSKMNNRHKVVSSIEEIELSGYDKFIFEKVPKGANAGEFLHNIFEHIDYQYSTKWLDVVKNSGQKYGVDVKEEDEEGYKQFIEHILHVKLNDFSLVDTYRNKRINELEFLFNFSVLDKKRLCEIIPELELDYVLDIKGIFTGFIDLFFEHKGKYYILDWKSNHLGKSLGNYKGEDLRSAIVDNNYHLQYHLYALAVHRFLKQRISDYTYERYVGGAFYLFLRGIRSNETSGVYFDAIPEERVLEMDKLFRGE